MLKGVINIFKGNKIIVDKDRTPSGFDHLKP